MVVVVVVIFFVVRVGGAKEEGARRKKKASIEQRVGCFLWLLLLWLPFPPSLCMFVFLLVDTSIHTQTQTAPFDRALVLLLVVEVVALDLIASPLVFSPLPLPSPSFYY